MTQLNLSGRQSNNTQQPKSTTEEGSIKNQTVGALGALAMFAAVIVIGSCSSSKPVAVQQQPIQPAAPVSAPAVTAPAPVAPPTVAKTKTKKRRPATFSYVNREYGVTFAFPRQYVLKSGDAAQLSWGDLGPFLTDFVHPGGVTLAAVELPANSYPGTDFKSAFLTLSVNPGMTAEACTQFAFPEAKDAVSPSSTEKSAEKIADSTAKVRFGATEFSETEDSTVATMQQADARYYHAFNNGTCYEFALGIGTEGDGNVEGVTPVDRQAVFSKLEKILASVKLQPTAVSQTETPVHSAQPTVTNTSAKTQEESVIDRK